MAKVALSIRLNEQTQIKDLLSGEAVDLESLAAWDELAETVYNTTFKPYFSNQEVVLSFCDAEEMRRLNYMYRNIDEVTDVLSFNAIGNLTSDLGKFDDLTGGADIDPDDASLGDVIICFDYAQRQALEQERSLKSELSLLFVHGVLHLLGYDHETREEANEMFKLQDRILSAKSSKMPCFKG